MLSVLVAAVLRVEELVGQLHISLLARLVSYYVLS